MRLRVIRTCPEETCEPLALEQSAAQAQVEESEDFAGPQSKHPLLEAVQLPCGVSRTDQCADRGSAHQVWSNACLLKRADDPYMRPTAGRAAAERKSHARSARCAHFESSPAASIASRER